MNLSPTPIQTPESEAIHYSDSDPLTPEEQFVVMLQHEEKMNDLVTPPTDNDLERYCYYIHKGIRKDMLAPQNKEVMDTILQHIPNSFLENQNLEALLNSLKEEIQNDYHIWLMKDIVDYILMDPDERKRLFIDSIPQSFPQRVIRAPVPWHTIYQEVKNWNQSHLFTVNPMMLTLQQLWFSEYNELRFVRTQEILAGDLPLLPSEFEDLVQKHCLEAHDILLNKWIPTCADLFINQKEKWLHLAPQNDLDSSQPIEEYFASVSILMSLQLREMVINSLQDLLNFFKMHENGNDFEETYHEMQFFMPQILVIKLDVEEPTIVFQPPMKGCWDLIYRCFLEILKNSEGLPKVQVKLFPELQGDDLTLRTVKEDETLVSEYVNKSSEIFDRNVIGPQKYLNVYTKYIDLLNRKADQDVTDFLGKKHELDDFMEKIDSLSKLKKEIASLHITVPLAMFCLDAFKLNEELCRRTQRLKDRLVQFQIDENREVNQSICNQYNIIADKVSEVPLTTEELVELTAYLKKASEVTVFKLRREIREAIYRLEFLLDYADLPYEDIKLNSSILHWPDEIEIIFDTSRIQLLNRRDHVELSLIKRCSEFEAILEAYNKEVDSFRKKDVMSMEEMKNNVEKFTELTKNLDNALAEYEAINKEEELLEREKSQFPLLQTIIAHKQPFEQLWVTAYNFHVKSEEWMNGPLLHLNAEEITEEVGNMWRTIYKLTKTLSEYPGPKRMAENVKFKIDKFKQHLPVLSLVCNRGMKDRHWDQVPCQRRTSKEQFKLIHTRCFWGKMGCR